MPAKRPATQGRPYGCDYPDCHQSFAEFAHLRSHQRSHQNKNKKLKTASPAAATAAGTNSHHLGKSSAGTPPSSHGSSPALALADPASAAGDGLTPLSTAPSSPRLPVPQTAQEYLLQRKLLQQQQQLLYMPGASAAPVVRKNKRKQPTPVKSPKRPDCLETPPGIVFVFPTWLDTPAATPRGPTAQSREPSTGAADTSGQSTCLPSDNQQQDLSRVEVEEVEEQYQRKHRPTPLRLNSSDFVVLVHPTTDKQLLANSSSTLDTVTSERSKAALKKGPLSQDAEAASVTTTRVATPTAPTGTNSPTGMEVEEEQQQQQQQMPSSSSSAVATSAAAQASLIHERLAAAEEQVVMA